MHTVVGILDQTFKQNSGLKQKGMLGGNQLLFQSDFCIWRLFWKAAYAETQQKFEACIIALYEQKEIAAEYVLSIPHENWATYAMQGRRYGHCISNLAEIANSVLRSFREMPLLEMLDNLYRHQ